MWEKINNFLKGHRKPITNAAKVGNTKTGHHFLIVLPTMIFLLFPTVNRSLSSSVF